MYIYKDIKKYKGIYIYIYIYIDRCENGFENTFVH